MGMFDYIIFETSCPKCGKRLNSFQSKSGPCILKTLNFWEVDQFYDFCDNCNMYVTFTLKDEVRQDRPKYMLEQYRMTTSEA